MMMLFSILMLLLALTAQGLRVGHDVASSQSRLDFKNELGRKGISDSEMIHSHNEIYTVDKKRKWKTDRPLIGLKGSNKRRS